MFTTATFVGYVIAGNGGAAAAALGIFLPAFAFVALSGPLVPRLRRSPLARALLDGVNVASLALMAAVTWRLARATLVDGTSVALALASAVALLGFRVPSPWLLLAVPRSASPCADGDPARSLGRRQPHQPAVV